MTDRICPECGSDIYRSAGWDEMREARDRHWAKNQEQAIEILRLQLRVSELEEWRRTRNGKIERQRRTIRRLEEKLKGFGSFPHDDKPLGREGDPASPAPAFNTAPPSSSDPDYPSPTGMRRLRKNRQKAAE
jgi:hypothetical protein